MRRDTKLAIGIGVIIVVVGIWYINTPDTDESPGQEASQVVENADKQHESDLSETESADRQAADPAIPVRTDGERSTFGVDGPSSGTPTSLSQGDDQNQAGQPADRAASESLFHANRWGGASPDAAEDSALVTNRMNVADNHENRLALTGLPQPANAPTTNRRLPEPVRRTEPMVTANVDRRAPSKPQPPMKFHVIQPGDNYYALAKKYYGNVKHTSLIIEANPDKDPRKLLVGMKVKIPHLPNSSSGLDSGITAAGSPRQPRAIAEPVPSIPQGRAYEVKEGENWSILARRFYGDSSRWPELYELNRERVPQRDRLLAGTIIEIPKSSVSN